MAAPRRILIYCIDSSEEVVADRPSDDVVSGWQEIVGATVRAGPSQVCAMQGWSFITDISHTRLLVDVWKGRQSGCPLARAFVTPGLVGRELPRVAVSAVGLAYAAEGQDAEGLLREAVGLVTSIAWGWLG